MDANSLLWGGNDLLAILPESTLNRMAPRCSRVTLQKGEVISEADQPIASVLFIESGVASIFSPGLTTAPRLPLPDRRASVALRSCSKARVGPTESSFRLTSSREFRSGQAPCDSFLPLTPSFGACCFGPCR